MICDLYVHIMPGGPDHSLARGQGAELVASSGEPGADVLRDGAGRCVNHDRVCGTSLVRARDQVLPGGHGAATLSGNLCQDT